MVPRIAEMRHISDYRIWLKFEDGKEGEIDLEAELWGEVFQPLRQQDLFKTVELNREINAICWKNGADLAPEFLYDNLTESLVHRELARAKE